jgi:hypothetical protein
MKFEVLAMLLLGYSFGLPFEVAFVGAGELQDFHGMSRIVEDSI